MTAPLTARRAAERWFLDRGLPWVLTRRGRLRAVWSRSAPALAGAAIVAVCALAIYLLVGSTTVAIEGEPTPTEWVVLAVVVLALPLAFTVGWIVARIASRRARAVASAAAVTVGLVAAAIDGHAATMVDTAVIVVTVLALTASGIGSVLGWSARLTMSQLAAAGGLVIRALPVVLLTILVFFNSPVWLMVSTISRGRLWLAVGFMVAVAAVFVFSGTLERAGPLLRSASVSPAPGGHSGPLAGTPFEQMADPAEVDALRWGERVNVIFVLLASQMVQIVMVAAVTAAIFFVLGLIVLSPELLAAWTRNPRPDGTVLNMTIPVPQALIQITLFLGALTFMYISARVVGDGEYRSRFLDPLIDDLKLSLLARSRYRNQRLRGGP
jgi:hypothetical protein